MVKPSPSTVKTKGNEISKKRLLELAKTDSSAREVNSKYNDLNKVLLADLRRHAKKVQILVKELTRIYSRYTVCHSFVHVFVQNFA